MAADLLLTVVFLILIVCLAYGPWQWACTDCMRQACFETRDALFDMAADGKMDFKSSDYRRLRSSIEGRIRFAHEATLPHILWLAVFVRSRMNLHAQMAVPTESALVANINDESTRSAVEALLWQMNKRVIVFVVLKSPAACLLLVGIVAPLFFCFTAVKGYVRFAAKIVTNLMQLGAQLEDQARNTSNDSGLHHA